MKKKEWTYCAPEDGPDTWFTFKVQENAGPEDGDWIASEAAEDYHSNHGGWESRWPMMIKLRDEAGNDVGTFTVCLEMQPTFYAERVKRS